MDGIRIGVLGNVDSAKSTTISVLKHNILDNGRGSARKKVFKHKHEQDTGRTSSINHTHIKVKDRMVSYVDLAGHEKYLKTTVFGLNACSIDYVLLLVGANMGVTRMTKEHFKLTHALGIPIIFVITKIDICPENIMTQTLNDIYKIIKIGYKKKPKTPIIVNSEDNINNKFYRNNILPIFKISNTTGFNIELLKKFINNLDPILNYKDKIEKEPLFTIEETFFVNGIGCVVSGVVKEGIIKIGDKLTIGPFNGIFKNIVVKSIHDNFRNNINQLNAGMSGCICIKSNRKDNIKKKKIKKGMVINKEKIDTKNSFREFCADVLILHHPTTIKENYQPVIHCGNISQSAKICKITSTDINKDCLRTGDRSEIRFMFTNRPECIKEGSKLIFREGKCKGIGKVTKLIS
jgi:small GTP-binding protein